ncbi:cis-prenyl transferase [Fragilaria crotonensis]|nr:cis-prenyl transferase [Fragilaria crotonensis]
MIALRWAKIFIIKVARLYYGAPICLMMVPLLFGLALGYAVGTRNCHKTVPKQRHLRFLKNDPVLVKKEEQIREELKGPSEARKESNVDVSLVPKHIAVIMDGNRRYGKKYHPENPTQGHWDGSKTLVSFCKWCIAEQVQILTVYAFSTENWNRSADEVAALMAIFSKYCDELRVEAIQRNIQIRVLSTETDRIPPHVKAGMKRMVDETAHCEGGLLLNICLSYGSRGEIVHACRDLASDVQKGALSAHQITEDAIQQRLLSPVDPDVIIRTSGEHRISNFLLWQLAYAELFFLEKTWPEMQKQDLVEVIEAYAGGRERRFGR